MSTTTRRFSAALLLAPAVSLVGFWASAASAEVLLFSANQNGQRFDSAGLVDLNGTAAGGTTLTFATTQANQRVSIIFNTNCGFFQDQPSGEHTGYARVEIIVDPAGSVGETILPPTNSGDYVLCADHDPAVNFDSENAVVVTSARPSQAGTHKVKVRVIPTPFTAESSISVGIEESTLTIMR